MSAPRRPVFVSRDAYRSRRLKDAARLLPVLGAALFALPLLWRSEGAATVGTAGTLLFIFVVWAGLILSAFLIARQFESGAADGAEAEPDRAEPPPGAD
ncbi:hypothetical protein DRV85_17830 [Rhodosalinus halophilus]|jgi:hypothetical protein|uniref:Uncharacterized protein n=1 Tax=Rhodosalinus halophilus TaxID=2259333 RepID=A0A365U4X4_9RHOB|nr:hypothetical protein [Rhodosalinus halophilus]RBI82887.1 hypothetical protein DRV85_17830 [Rhodosalinus halophilus]